MKTDPRRVEALLTGAVAIIDPRERTAYLDGACAGDSELRREVESLLGAHAAAGEFLEAPADQARVVLSPAEQSTSAVANETLVLPFEQAGEQIGRYRLLEKIGEGGMGVVWMAEQVEPVRRRVALKIIKLGMDTREVIARFEAERQALALMDHPNIAKVFDGGVSAAGRPYFVMELVRGLRITQYCDQHRLSTSQRIELFVRVCQAVQHAHQKGIIHRDLKPSNILVTVNDGAPVPKVIDFGIAKATDQRLTDKTLFTRFLQFMGTPAYMSPEQAELTSLDIDTRSDIYALGVLLYELLTGHTPFDGKDFLAAGLDEMRRVIREREPLRPSTRLSALQHSDLTSAAERQRTDPPRLIAALRGDLDWIVMKCLEKDRARRYDTAVSLGQDLQRHLNSEPVVARPPSALYRGQKFVRKHRTAVAVAAGFVLLLTAATAVSIGLALWASRERRGAEQATKVAMESEADTDAFAGFLVRDVLATARPKGRQGGLGIDVTVTNALAAAEAKIEKTFENRPRAEATARHAIGVTWRNLGKYEAAEPHLRRALEIRERECGEASREAWEARNSYGVLLSARARYAEAARFQERNVEIWRASSPINPPTSTESIVRTLVNLAAIYGHIGREVEAVNLFQEAVDLATTKLGPESSATWDARTRLASARYRAGHYEEAARFYADELAELMKSRGPDDLETLISMNQLGLAYLRCERLDEGLSLLTNAFQRLPSKLGEGHPDMLVVRDNMAKAFESVGRLPDAIPLAVKNLKLCEETLGLEHPRTVDYMLRLAELYSRGGRLQEALPLFQQAYDRRVARSGPDHRDTFNALSARALAHERCGDYTNALPLFETILRRMRTALGTNSTDTLTAMKNLAGVYGRAGRLMDALPLYQEALHICTNQFGLSSSLSLRAMSDLARGWRDAGKLADAILLMRQAVRGYEAKLGADHSDLLRPMSDLGEMLLRTNAFAEAEPLLQRVYQGHKQRDSSSADGLQASSNSVMRLVRLYESWGKPERAAEWRKKLK